MAYYAQPTSGTTTSPYSSPPIAGAVYPPGTSPYGTSPYGTAASGTSSTHTSPTLPGQPPMGVPGAPLSPYAQTAYAHGGASPQQRVSPGAAYAPLVTPGVAGIGAGTGVGGVGAAAPVPYAPAAGSGQTIQPGSVTYTTTLDNQGRVTYHQFR